MSNEYYTIVKSVTWLVRNMTNMGMIDFTLALIMLPLV